MKIDLNIFKILLIFPALLMSCSDFLDLKPISEETSASAYNKASQIEAALVGTYESFQSDTYTWNNILLEDVRSDNCYAGGDNPELFEMDYLKISATNSKIEQAWSNCYNAILKANVVLEYVNDVTDPNLTEVRRQQIIGEATFLRAYHYFRLVKWYGAIPLITEATQSADPADVRIPRSPVEDVYEQILKDLEDADNLLPDTYGNDASVNKARATAGAANALAAKVSAQMGDYVAALEYIERVENSEANYQLLSDYTHLFDGNHYNNAESILEAQYIGESEGNWGPQLFLPPSISGDTWRKFVTPSHNLVQAFDDAGDEVRKNASIIWEAVDWVDEYWGNETGSTIPFAYKMKNAMGWASTDRLYFLRYGDILLLKAEALNETDDQPGAIQVLNQMRDRVDLPALDISDKGELRTAILEERRLELALEAQRWSDLMRHDLVVQTMNNLVEIDLRTNQPTDYDMTEDKILLPIPQSEIDRNPELTPNP